MKNIPKIAHFYWGGKILPYLRYMTLKSFQKTNLDWKIILYSPTSRSDHQSWLTHEHKCEMVGPDYSDHLKQLGIEQVNIDFNQFGLSNDLPEVIKSDFLRLFLLSTVGGLWSDLDIVYFRPISSTFLSDSQYTTYMCYNSMPWGGIKFYSIGFMMASPSNPVFANLHSKALSLLKEKPLDETNPDAYQVIGSTFYNPYINLKSSFLYNIPMEVVYPVLPFDRIWDIPAKDVLQDIKDRTIGVHWYAGYPKSGAFQNKLNEATYKEYDNIITYFLKTINNES